MFTPIPDPEFTVLVYAQEALASAGRPSDPPSTRALPMSEHPAHVRIRAAAALALASKGRVQS